MSLPPPDPKSTCLVTGASSGIGEEIARELARRGHGVTLAARREDRLTELSEELEAEHGVRAETIALDVADAGARAGLPAQLEERGVQVEVLVNNAGFGSGGAFAELDTDEETSMVRTNFEALVGMTGVFLPPM